MTRKHGRYPHEYREEIIALARGGTPVGELASRFEPSEQTIRNWINQADRDAGRRNG